MSRFGFRVILALTLFAVAAGGAAVGVGSAASIESALQDALQPSAAPALLGPITEAGRKGWACKPEQAASARHWQDAELPPAAP